MTHKDMIVNLLATHPDGLTDRQIATMLNAPIPSIRRTRSHLEDLSRVWMHPASSGKELVWTTRQMEMTEPQTAGADGCGY